jgi:SAM-dependent methyltransferase
LNAQMGDFASALRLTTDEWVMFLAGVEAVRGVATAPPLPDVDTQRAFVGSSGLAAMREAALFYDRVLAALGSDGVAVSNIGPTLDFGCGWGRIYRLFLRNCGTGDLVGVDVDEACVQMCRAAMPFGSFEECNPMPPLTFPPESFEVVVAYSVFSHLAESAFLAWMREFRRVLRPKGRIFFTTLKQAHLETWQGLRDDAYYGPVLAEAGFDRTDWKRRAQSGSHLFVPIGGGGVRDRSYYGEAIVSRSFLDRSIGELGFEASSFEDSTQLPQVFIGLRAT